MNSMIDLASRAKKAAFFIGNASTAVKNKFLEDTAALLHEKAAHIIAANKKDLLAAEQSGMRAAQLDRLTLDERRIDAIAQGVRQVAMLEDPIGEVVKMTTQPNGLIVGKKRVPLGVIGMIYESRPNVTIDAASLCLKAGNAVVLRGGKEAIHSNIALVAVLRQALKNCNLPEDCVCFVEDTSRQSALEMMQLTGYLDVLIPRGGAGLIATVVQNAKVPIIETGIGNCHIYVDDSANLEMAADIVCNAKCSRPSVCNAAESLVVSEAIAAEFLPMAQKALAEYQVEMRGCQATRDILGESIILATEEDYKTEFLDYIISVKILPGLTEAIDFINQHSTKHSEAIVTENYSAAQRFLNEIDSAAVYVNASTRYTDGSEFGLGAEIGISTQKLHARGPMGLKELTSTKHIVYGSGQVRW